MKIRPLENKDIDQVVKLWINSFSDRYDQAINHNHISDTKSTTLVSVENKTVTGVASLYVIEKLTRKLGLIEDVAVNEKFRGKGIGKRLVRKLIEIAAAKNCDKTVLNSSEDNLEFYNKLGFDKNEIQMIIRKK
ncbi:MAG: GNAT family N-acetyltransferase [Bacteroidetes bacterium]|jgi:ribosomal protein S18 acetylase RimI-like enzyme|nr:GNAT family N-acetyltransferase [Bacteroidota bacterium]MDA1019891.1 GNAT family N-acetyltransferase [Bacteroidota bacterium]|tara:strand:+ start:30215 stop:30616 length:402 start_codon:yes stop_codon:yes gene_type:complete